MVTKVTFVGPNFTRKAPKYERFIRPTGLRMKQANVTHPELQATFQLQILGVKKNPQSAMYTTLGVITKGTVIEVCIASTRPCSAALLPVAQTPGKTNIGEPYLRPFWQTSRNTHWRHGARLSNMSRCICVGSTLPPCALLWQVNVSELGLVTNTGKVVWGECFLSASLHLSQCDSFSAISGGVGAAERVRQCSALVVAETKPCVLCVLQASMRK